MPRLGLGSLELSSLGGTGQDVVTTIDDFFFESNASGEVNPMQTASRKNFIENSEVFTTWNNESRQVVTANAGISPSGANDASKLVVSNGFASQRKIWIDYQNVQLAPDSPFVVGETITFSVHIKKISGQVNTGYLYVTTGANDTFAAQQSFTATDDWQLVSVTAVVQDIATRVYITGDSDAQLLIWGAQIEQDGFATSYIATSGSPVTVSTTLNDTSEVWDFDGTDITLEADPEDEGFWEEGSNLVLNHDYADLGSEEVTNGDFSQISSELVTNGGFATDSDWSKDAGWTISNGAASCNGSGINSLQQSGITTTGKVYKLTFDITSLTNESGFLVISTDFSDTYVGPGTDNSVVVGSNTFYIQPTSGTGIRFRIADGTTCTIDNVSIKEVGQDWSFNTGWSMGDGKALALAVNGDSLQQSVSLDNTKIYQIQFEISNYVEGEVRVRFAGGGSAVSTAYASGNNTHTLYLESTGNTLIRLQGQNDFTGSIDNISVKEVDPNDRWVSEADWTIEDGVAKGNGASGSSEELRQDGILTVGDTYEFTFTIKDYSSGSVELINNGLGSLSSNGVHTGIGVATSTDLRFRGSSFNGSIDNVTVKEYAITPLDV